MPAAYPVVVFPADWSCDQMNTDDYCIVIWRRSVPIAIKHKSHMLVSVSGYFWSSVKGYNREGPFYLNVGEPQVILM